MAKPPARGKRLFKLASMTASVASGYARSKARSMIGGDAEEEERSFRKASGERIAATLGELKGAAMKVGQMASAAKELFPPEVTEALTKLQKEAPPMPFETISEVVVAELGDAPELLFQDVDSEPFAAASIGQVHRARTDDGREVVLKVQYPGVDDALDSDLQQVKLALRLGGLVKVDKRMIDATFAELRDRMAEELDYCNEADNVRRFHGFHEPHERIVVPDVVGERSAKRVLTLTYEPGKHLHDLGQPGVSQGLRDSVGHELASMLTRQLFELQAVHGDPNPGNFAYRDDGTLVVYDFGCVKEISDEMLVKLRLFLRRVLDRDYEGLNQSIIDIGRMRPGHRMEPHEWDMFLDALAAPFYVDGAFDYGQADLGARVKALIPWAMKRASWWEPVPELTILNRAVGGLYDNLREMKAQVDVRSVLEPYLT